MDIKTYTSAQRMYSPAISSDEAYLYSLNQQTSELTLTRYHTENGTVDEWK